MSFDAITIIAGISRILQLYYILIIAGVSLVLDLCLVLYILKYYREGKKFIPSEADLLDKMKVCFENPDSAPPQLSWILELSKEEQSTLRIKEMIRKQFFQANDRIQHLANLGPAFALVFTFVGMLVAIYRMGGSDAVARINEAVSALYPVFIGGAFGIFVYGYGIFLLQRLEAFQSSAEHVLSNAVIEFLRKQGPLVPRTPQEALDEILKRVAKLATRFDRIGGTLNTVSNVIDTMVAQFSERTTGFVDHLDQRSQSLHADFSQNITAIQTLNNTLSRYSDSVAQGAEGWKQSGPALALLMESITGLNEQLATLARFAQSSEALSGKLDSTNTQSGELIAEMRREMVEQKNLVQRIESMTGSVQGYLQEVQSRTLEIDSFKRDINGKIGLLSDKLKDLSDSVAELVALAKRQDSAVIKDDSGNGQQQTEASMLAIKDSVAELVALAKRQDSAVVKDDSGNGQQQTEASMLAIKDSVAELVALAKRQDSAVAQGSSGNILNADLHRISSLLDQIAENIQTLVSVVKQSAKKRGWKFWKK